MKTSALKPNEYNPFYQRYFDQVNPAFELLEALRKGQTSVNDFFSKIPENKLTYRYAEGKWSVLEVLQHLIDTERVFMYRCFRIGRRDSTPLAGFEQDDYIEPAVADSKSMEQLIGEFNCIRKAFINLVESLSDEDLAFVGNANGSAMSARAAAFMVPGHDIWHMNIIRERYL